MNQTKAIAFYLPQYHPIPENDRWWGKGFTEWINVTQAQPLFDDHYQPHLPADLGFYDLRLPEARIAQAELAKEYGVYGFCYYHYWFHGKRLLERPFNEVLGSGEPDFPFCLCWANETWSRRWLGEEKDILIKQTYSQEDDYNHIQWLVNAFADDRYIKIDNRPLFLIYRPKDLPSIQKTLDIFRNECMKKGLENPYIVGVDAHSPGYDYRKDGFDSTLAFEPQLGCLPNFKSDRFNFSKLIRNRQMGVDSAKLKIYDYLEAREKMTKRKRKFPHLQSVFVGWDNTARRGKDGIIMINSSPDKFKIELKKTIENSMVCTDNNKIVFINAWNEWAEGNHLEPDLLHGCGYLEAVKEILAN